jgi:hypothetical protein
MKRTFSSFSSLLCIDVASGDFGGGPSASSVWLAGSGQLGQQQLWRPPILHLRLGWAVCPLGVSKLTTARVCVCVGVTASDITGRDLTHVDFVWGADSDHVPLYRQSKCVSFTFFLPALNDRILLHFASNPDIVLSKVGVQKRTGC